MGTLKTQKPPTQIIAKTYPQMYVKSMDKTLNQQMVDNLITNGALKTKRIIEAFYLIDRIDFVGKGNENSAYLDEPLSIGFVQTISQPSTVAFMLELLAPCVNDKILDIGSGSGWTTALLATIIGSGGQVTGIERISQLVKLGNENLKKYDLKNTEIVQTGKQLGLPSKKFDKILVSAAANTFPETLIGQLEIGGILVVPVANSIVKAQKTSDDTVGRESFYGFRFVPLIK